MRWGLHYGSQVESGYGVYTVVVKDQPVQLPQTSGLIRINWGYHPEGTVPPPEKRNGWIKAVLNTIRMNKAAGWIIGNAPNHSREWPAGHPISPEYYAGIVREIWNEAPRTAVILAAAPDPYHSNPNFPDPLAYLREMIKNDLRAEGFALNIKAFGSAQRWPIHGDVFGDPPLKGAPYGIAMLSVVLKVLDEVYPGAMVYLTQVNHQDDPNPQAIDNLVWAVESIAHNSKAAVAGGFIYNVGLGDRWDLSQNAPREALESRLRELSVAAPFGWLVWPVDGEVRITQLFGVNPDKYRPYGLPGHEGLDIISSSSTLVRAAASGPAEARHNGVYGNFVVQQTSLPVAGKLFEVELVYAHLEEVYVKKEGEWVGAGAPIGRMGATGRAWGIHLHFGVRILANKDHPEWRGWTNPLQWLPPTFKEVRYV